MNIQENPFVPPINPTGPDDHRGYKIYGNCVGEEITNDEFLAAIFGTSFSETSPLVCSKPGDPDLGGWVAQRWPCPTGDTNRNWYCLPSLLQPDETGKYRATKDLAVSVHSLMLDDVGTKVDSDLLAGITPSWSIETSPGNHQIGFILYPPVKDMSRLEGLKSALIDAGLCDPGATGVSTRWMRLPNGINGRPRYGTPAFRCRLDQWNPLSRFSIDKLEALLHVKKPSEVTKGHQGGRGATNSHSDTVIQKLKRLGVYKKALGGGKHDITCPWVSEHTDEIDNGAAYFEPTDQYPQGGFRCHHSHGANLHVRNLLQYLGVPENEQNHGADISWPEPRRLPSQLLPVPKLAAEVLPCAIRDGVADISERLGCPIEYVAIPTLVGAGIVAGNRIGIWPKQYDESWRVFPGFWGGIVGEPGTMKTPALNAAFAPLYTIERLEIDGYRAALAKYHADRKIYEKSITDFRLGKNVNVPPEPVEPLKPRLIVNDSTYQALGEILSANPRGVLALADELSGLLQSLDTAGQEAARGFYLSGWGGAGNYAFDRVTRGAVCLTNYMLCVFGGFQPARIGAYVQFAQGGNSKNDGLLQRFQMLVWPDVSNSNTGIDRSENKPALKRMHNAIERLRNLNNDPIFTDIRTKEGVVLLHFEPDAQLLFNGWYHDHELTLRSSGLDSPIYSHFAKYRSLVPGLALLFHLLDGHTNKVCGECLTAAIQVSEYLKSHALRVYASVHGTDHAPARELAMRLLANELESGFTVRSIYTKGWRHLSTPEKALRAVEILTELNWLTEHHVATGGRSKTTYKVNPEISQALL